MQAMIKIKKRDCGKYGVLFLAFMVTDNPLREPHHKEELIMTGETGEIINLRLWQYKKRFGNDIPIVRKF